LKKRALQLSKWIDSTHPEIHMGRKRTVDRSSYRSDSEETEEKEVEETDDEDEDEDEDADEDGDGDGEEAEAESDDDAGGDDDDSGGDDDDDEDRPKKKKKPKPKVVAKKPVKRTRAAKITRMKAVWSVLDNSNKLIEQFEYKDKTSAETFIEEKKEDKKGLYLQMQKVPME
jgi:hypothetical protein